MKAATLVLSFEYDRHGVPLACDCVYEVDDVAEGRGRLHSPHKRCVELLRQADGQLIVAVTTGTGEALVPEPDELAQALRRLYAQQEVHVAELRRELEREEARAVQWSTLLARVVEAGDGPYR